MKDSLGDKKSPKEGRVIIIKYIFYALNYLALTHLRVRVG